MVGALAAVLGDAAAELRELQNHRVAEQPLITQVVVKRAHRVAVGSHQVRVVAGSLVALPRVRVEAAGLHPVDARAGAANDGAGDGAQRNRKTVVLIRHGAGIGGDCGDAIERLQCAGRTAVHQRQLRAIHRNVRRDARRRGAFVQRLRGIVRAVETVRPRVGNCRHADLARRQRAGKLACGRPSRERVRGYGLEIAPEPSHACGVGRICGSPDVEPLEMRAARIQVPGALDDRQPAFVENVTEAAKPGMQPEGAAARVGPDLQHRACRD